jgi:hypothetical protein
MSSTQENNQAAIVSFNKLIGHLAGTLSDDRNKSHEIVRRMWNSKILNTHVTIQQSRYGMAWMKDILGSYFRVDGDYEKVITSLVKAINGWPNKDSELQELTHSEQKSVTAS